MKFWFSMYLGFFISFLSICSCYSQGKISENDTIIYAVAMQQPAFPGGYAMMYKFINENINWPKSCVEDSIKGSVYCQFVVEKDGELSHIEHKYSGGNITK